MHIFQAKCEERRKRRFSRLCLRGTLGYGDMDVIKCGWEVGLREKRNGDGPRALWILRARWK